MALTVFDNDTQLQLFVAGDAYHYPVDNRPLRRLQSNIRATKAAVDAISADDYETITFVLESPSAETDAGGIYQVQATGEIQKIVLSHGTMGDAGQTVVTVKVNGSSITTVPNKPTLIQTDPDKVDVTPIGEIASPGLNIGDLVSIDISEVQTGSPRWCRVDIFSLKDQGDFDATDYTTWS